MTGDEKFRLKVVDDLRKNRVIVDSDDDYIALLKKANKDLGELVRERDQRVAELEKIIQRQQFIEDRYEELMLSARRCWRYYGADTELFNASIKTMDFLIRRHATEIDEMNEEQE